MAFFNHTSNYVQIKRLSTKYDQFQLFKKIYQMYDKAFILESLFGPKELSENSIIGFDPEYTISCDSKKFAISDRKEKIQEFEVTNPLHQLRRLVPRVTDNRFRYLGGAVGYISYDAIRFLEDLPVKKRRKNRFPLLEFGIYLDGLLFSHLENQAYYFCMGRKSRLDEIEKKLRKASTGRDRFSYSTPKNNLTRSEFTKMVNSAKKYIYDGDIFQVVLSRSLNFEVKGDPIEVYSHLREINPSPYMYMLRMGDHVIIGSSPEMLLRITNDYVETFPIAGTRPALKDKAQNEKLRMELINDKKEIAEHTMLVDLARNDIGRVCKYGTVKVNDFMTVKQFSHVQHIVSHVTGRLDESYDSFDAIKAVFPAGTVSGAPKVRAMEIIDELEPNQRGPYGGALGYFSANGSADFAITIRSLFILKNSAYIQAGAGIVIDSVPQKEWLEMEQKANALLSAIKYSKLTRN